MVKYIKQHIPYPVKQIKIVKVREPYVVKIPVYPKEYHHQQHTTSYEQHSPQSYEPSSGYQSQNQETPDSYSSSGGEPSSDNSYNSPSSSGGGGGAADPSVSYVTVHSGPGDYRTKSEGQKENSNNNDYGEEGADEGKYYQTQEQGSEDASAYGGQAPQTQQHQHQHQHYTIGQSMPSYSTQQQHQQQQYQQAQYENEPSADQQGGGRHGGLTSAASGQVKNQVDVVVQEPPNQYQHPKAVSIEYQVKHLSTQTQYQTGQLMNGKLPTSYAQEGGGEGNGQVSEHRYSSNFAADKNSNGQMDKKM